MPSSPSFFILSLDGGGIRGIILALGLTVHGEDDTPRYTVSDLVDLYDEEGADIFQSSGWKPFETAKSLFDEKYDAANIERILKDRFGEASLSDALTPVLVPAYEIEQRRPYFFKSHRALKLLARDLIEDRSAEIDRLCDALT